MLGVAERTDVRPRRVDAVERRHRRLDLSQLDPEAAEFHLAIASSHEFDGPVAGHPDVAGPVHPTARRSERVGDVPCGRLTVPVQEPAGDLGARDVQFTGHAVGHGGEPTVEDVHPRTEQRGPDVGGGCPVDECARQFPTGHVDGGLGGTVHVVQLRARDIGAGTGRRPVGRPVRLPCPDMLVVEEFAREVQAPNGVGQSTAEGWADDRRELIERRRGEVDDRDPVSVERLDHVVRGAGRRVVEHEETTAGAQCGPDLADRDVERVGVKHRPHVVGRTLHYGVERIEQRHHVVVGDDNAFGAPGGSGGVHHVGARLGGHVLRQRWGRDRPGIDVVLRQQVLRRAQRRGHRSPGPDRLGVGHDGDRRRVLDDPAQARDRMCPVEG